MHDLRKKMLALVEQGKGYDFIKQKIDQFNPTPEEKKEILSEVNEEIALYELKKQQEAKARFFLISGMFVLMSGLIFIFLSLLIYGRTSFWFIAAAASGVILYLKGKNIREKRVTLSGKRMIKKGRFKRF